MPFSPKFQAYNAKINEVTLGTGDGAITIGGNNTLPFYAFDAETKNKAKIGIEISDIALEKYTQPQLKAFYEGCSTVADMAVKAQEIKGASFIALNFESADPNGTDTPIADCVALAKEVAEKITLPLVIMGCKNTEKDAELFSAVSEALPGKNILVLSAKEENYKSVGASVALAYGHKVGAESAVDTNLAKQLNTVVTQLGVPAASIVMQAGSSAAGYGFEYLASTLDRIKLAALEQNDAMLQMPIMTPVSTEAWNVKEAIMDEAEMPEWGSVEERGIEMEITTAAACLACGSDAVIMRHPEAVRAVAEMIDELA